VCVCVALPLSQHVHVCRARESAFPVLVFEVLTV